MARAVIQTLQSERVKRSIKEGHAQISSAWELYNATPEAETKRWGTPQTLRRYKSSMTAASNGMDGGDEITAEAIKRWALKQQVGGRTNQYINKVLRDVRSCVAVVADTEEEAGAFTRLLKALRKVPRLFEEPLAPRCPPDDFLRRVLPSARNAGEEHFMVLLGRTGLRENEARGLTPSSFQPQNKTLVVNRQRYSMQRKNKIRHEILLDADLELRIRWLMQPTNRASLQSSHRNGNLDAVGGFLFPWTDHHMRKFLLHVQTSLGEERNLYFPSCGGWHIFRHHAAAECVRAGGTTDDVQRLLGDNSPSAAQTYMDALRGVKKARPVGLIPDFDMSQKRDV